METKSQGCLPNTNNRLRGAALTPHSRCVPSAHTWPEQNARARLPPTGPRPTPTLSVCADQPASPALSVGNSLEVLGILRDGHVDDVEGMLIVFLGGEKERQQVEGVGVILAHFQGLLQLLHGAGDLPEKGTS